MLKNVEVSNRSVWANANDVGTNAHNVEAKLASPLKYRKMLKKALCLIFAFLLSINSFAAIVSHNDGSAFVSKSEFEALKQEFANQIDKYNDSIDSKIDGAIASYLAGIYLNNKDIIKTKLDTVMLNNKWPGIKNLGDSKITEYFGTVCKPEWIYGATALVASFATAANLENLTAVAWTQWANPDEPDYNVVGSSGLSWHLYKHNFKKTGSGYALWGDGTNKISKSTTDTYASVADNMFTRYQYSNATTAVWYEYRGPLEFEQIYNNEPTSNIRQFGFYPYPATMADRLRIAWRWFCGCTLDVEAGPIITTVGHFTDSEWQNNGIIRGDHDGTRATTKLGTFTASLHEGDNVSFISKANTNVLLYDSEKKYYKIYPDTDLDYTSVMESSVYASFGTTNATQFPGRCYHTNMVLIPVLAPVNVDNSGSNYFGLQQLTVSSFEDLQEDKTKTLTYADGLPLAYITKVGKGEFNIKIVNNDSSETFNDFEVYLSTKPFSELSSLDDALDIDITVGGSTVSTVPKDTEATIIFNVDTPKSQLYMWWQAKNQTYGGMLTQVTDISFEETD